MRIRLAVATLVALAGHGANAQGRAHWFIGVGPSVVMQRGVALVRDDPALDAATDTLLIGAERGRGSAVVGATRRVPKTAIDLRLAATYSRATSARAWTTWSWGTTIRTALREETVGLEGGLEWSAIPGSAWSPYITTAVGSYSTWLNWNADSTQSEPNRSKHIRHVATHLGFGLRASVLGANLFVESRRQWWTSDWNHSRAVPLIVGFRLR